MRRRRLVSSILMLVAAFVFTAQPAFADTYGARSYTVGPCEVSVVHESIQSPWSYPPESFANAYVGVSCSDPTAWVECSAKLAVNAAFVATAIPGAGFGYCEAGTADVIVVTGDKILAYADVWVNGTHKENLTSGTACTVD